MSGVTVGSCARQADSRERRQRQTHGMVWSQSRLEEAALGAHYCRWQEECVKALMDPDGATVLRSRDVLGWL